MKDNKHFSRERLGSVWTGLPFDCYGQDDCTHDHARNVTPRAHLITYAHRYFDVNGLPFWWQVAMTAKSKSTRREG